MKLQYAFMNVSSISGIICDNLRVKSLIQYAHFKILILSMLPMGVSLTKHYRTIK